MRSPSGPLAPSSSPSSMPRPSPQPSKAPCYPGKANPSRRSPCSATSRPPTMSAIGSTRRATLKAEWIHEIRPDPGPAGADDVNGRHITDVPDLIGFESKEVDGRLEDPGIRLHDADVAGVDDALDVHADPGAYLAQLELREPRTHHAVGVRDDAEANSGVREGLEAFAATGNRFDPQCRIGELAVEVEMGLV